jgi:rhodanese-related sulfurtransferase
MIVGMVRDIGREQVRELLTAGAQLVEVLERRQYRAAHLPGARHIPAWEMTAERAEAELAKDEPVVVYCFDSL